MTKASLVLLASFRFPSLVGRSKDKIDEKKLSSWKLLDDFRQRLAKAQVATPTCEKRAGGPERLLLEEDYFSLMLFGLFNPVLDSMRGWQGTATGHRSGDRSGVDRFDIPLPLAD